MYALRRKARLMGRYLIDRTKGETEREVTPLTVVHEAVERLDIMSCRTVPACLAEQTDLMADKVEQGGLVAVLFF